MFYKIPDALACSRINEDLNEIHVASFISIEHQWSEEPNEKQLNFIIDILQPLNPIFSELLNDHPDCKEDSSKRSTYSSILNDIFKFTKNLKNFKFSIKQPERSLKHHWIDEDLQDFTSLKLKYE